MLLHNLDLCKKLQKWTYRQKVVLHAVMGKMALILYGEEGKRNEENDYVKFAVDVLSAFASNLKPSQAEANITIANWSLESYVKVIDKWIQDDPPCPNKDLYHAKASILTVIIGAFDNIPLLQPGEVDALLDGLQTNREYDYFTSEKVFDYCNMLFIEGMKLLAKIVPLDSNRSEVKSKQTKDEYHPANADQLIVRRTILWGLNKRVLLQAVCGHIANIINYEWPGYEKSKEYLSHVVYIMEVFCKGAPLRAVNSAVNVGTIIVDNLLIDVLESNKKRLYPNHKFDVAEMFDNSLRVAIGCIYDMPDEYADYIVSNIKFDDRTLIYDSKELQMLIDQILDFAENLSNNLGHKP